MERLVDVQRFVCLIQIVSATFLSLLVLAFFLIFLHLTPVCNGRAYVVLHVVFEEPLFKTLLDICVGGRDIKMMLV